MVDVFCTSLIEPKRKPTVSIFCKEIQLEKIYVEQCGVDKWVSWEKETMTCFRRFSIV